MKIITQDNLITDSSWWQAVDSGGKTLKLLAPLHENPDDNALVLAEYDNEETIQLLNEAFITAIGYSESGLSEFNVQEWEKENLV